MNELANDLMTFYQRELTSGESSEAQEACEKLGVTDARVFERYGVGFCSGAAIKTMGEKQRREAIDVGLIYQHPLGERFRGSLVIPVYGHNEDGNEQLVDLCGLRMWDSGVRFVNWQPRREGLIGLQCLTGLSARGEDQVILCDNPFHFMHAAQHGYTNLLAVREGPEIEQHHDLLEQSGVKRVCLASRQQRKVITPLLESRGIKVKYVKTPSGAMVIPKINYEEALISDEKRPAFKPSKPKPQVVKTETEPQETVDTKLTLVSKSDSRLVFTAETKDCPTIRYALDGSALTGLVMKNQIKASKEDDPKISFLDKVDLAVASQRKKTVKMTAARLGVPFAIIDDHLSRIAGRVDELIIDAASEATQQPVQHELSARERDEAMAVHKNQDVLSYLANALDRVFGFVGEEEAKRIALLVATSRLLPQPLAILLRGSQSSGKSSLMANVARTLPESQCLRITRMTPTAMYFLPREQLQHRLLVCDEYEGIENSEYCFRSLLSEQVLSVAFTSRSGGRLPVTRTIQVPVRLAVMVSTTGRVNNENLSRFIEVSLSSGSQQTKRVMRSMVRGNGIAKESEARKVQNAQSLLRPCEVEIPFAEKLAYDSPNVVARRKFAQVLGLIASHAALHQMQRKVLSEGDEEGTPLVIEACISDYQAVYPLLGSVVDHFEEDISPSAMRLLHKLNDEGTKFVTRQQVMDLMGGWSYSRAYRTIQELTKLDLLIADNQTNGVLRTYEVAASHIAAESKVSQLAPPEVVFAPEVAQEAVAV